MIIKPKNSLNHEKYLEHDIQCGENIKLFRTTVFIWYFEHLINWTCSIYILKLVKTKFEFF